MTEELGSKLIQKEYSPLVIRKYTTLSVPVFVALITDDNVDDLDNTVVPYLLERRGKVKTITDFRRLAGELTELLVNKYKKTEGAAVIIFPDKAAVSSLWGDFMNHHMCREELYMLINIMTKV